MKEKLPIFLLVGPLNNVSCFFIKAALAKHGFNHNMVLDCTRLTTIDGTGLGLLVEVYMTLKENGYTLSLNNLNGQPLDLMKTLGLQYFFKEDEQCRHQLELQNEC